MTVKRLPGIASSLTAALLASSCAPRAFRGSGVGSGGGTISCYGDRCGAERGRRTACAAKRCGCSQGSTRLRARFQSEPRSCATADAGRTNQRVVAAHRTDDLSAICDRAGSSPSQSIDRHGGTVSGAGRRLVEPRRCRPCPNAIRRTRSHASACIGGDAATHRPRSGLAGSRSRRTQLMTKRRRATSPCDDWICGPTVPRQTFRPGSARGNRGRYVSQPWAAPIKSMTPSAAR
jgi:hypothetical protein